MTKKYWLVLAGLALLLPSGQAFGFQDKEADKVEKKQDEAKQDVSPGKQIQKLLKAMDDEQKEFYAELAKARKEKMPRAEVQKKFGAMFAKMNVNNSKRTSKIMKIASKHPKADGVKDAMLKLLPTDRTGRIARFLLSHHSEGDSLLGFVASSVTGPFIDTRTLGKVLESNASDKVKSIAKYGLLVKKMANFKGDAEAEAEFVKEFKSSLEAVSKIKAGRVNFKKHAEEQLFVFQNLRIGKVAPEIDGIDIDGVEFKLSDYRGKVIFLDFWGDW